jgi:hypothetical protein
MDNYFNKFNYISKLNTNDIYCIKKGSYNITFITSCRGISLAIWLEEMFLLMPYFNNWQLGINVVAVHIIQQLHKYPTQNMKNIIENSDVIICECIKNYTYINTLKECSTNIYTNFNIKPECKIFTIPNLSLIYYINDIKHLYNTNNYTINDYIKIKNDNINKLIYWCEYYKFYDVSKYIKLNINKRIIFHTYNHPTTKLLEILFKELFKKIFNVILPNYFTENILKYKILDYSDNEKIKLDFLDYEIGIEKNAI